MLDDQLRRGLGAHPRHARHIIDAVAHQREHVAQPLGSDAKFFNDVLGPDPPVIHRVEQIDPRLDQLHQILVGRYDRDAPPCRQRCLCITSDDVVGLKPLCLNAGNRKGACCVADHGELRDQILRGRRPVCLVLVVHVVSKRLRRGVEDHRHVGRPVRSGQLRCEPPQHRRVSIDRPDWLATDIGKRRKPMISTKNIARTVNEVEMVGGHCGAGLAGSVGAATTISLHRPSAALR